MFITYWIIELFVELQHKKVLLVLVIIMNIIGFGFLYDMRILQIEEAVWSAYGGALFFI